MIKYRFAKGKENQIIDIFNLDKNNKRTFEPYSCLSCGDELIPTLGTQRAKHFRHKNSDISCNHETYLHRLGKQLFFETYNECLRQNKPFYLGIDYIKKCTHSNFFEGCELGTETKHVDITKYFDSIYMEKKIENFTPDILLKSQQDEYMFVEIAVTHECEPEKIASGFRIVEIKIRQEKDCDFLQYHNHKYSICVGESYKNNFYNFKRDKNNISDVCQGKCEQILRVSSAKYYCFLVCNNGSLLFHPSSLDDFLEKEKSKDIIYSNLLPFDFTQENNEIYVKEVYFKGLSSAIKEGILVKSCVLCEYSIPENSRFYETVFCKKNNSLCSDQKAIECPYFKIN